MANFYDDELPKIDPQQAQTPINPTIEEYLKNKFGLNYEKDAEQQNRDAQDRINAGAFASALGDAVAGRQVGSQNAYFNQLRTQAKADTVGKVKDARDQFVNAQLDQGKLDKLKEDRDLAVAKNDPDSDVSKAYRTLAQKFIPKWNVDGMNAAQLEKQLPALEKAYQVDQSTAAAKDRAAMMADYRKGIKDEKDEAQWNKDQLDFDVRLDPNKPRSGTLGKNQERMNTFARLKALALDKGGNVMNLSPQQVNELYAGLDAAITSNPSIAGRHELTPESKSKWIADKVQWLRDKPQGANQQAFIHQVMDTADREIGVVSKQIRDAQIADVPSSYHLRARHPERFDALLESRGLDPKMFDELGRVRKDYMEPVAQNQLAKSGSLKTVTVKKGNEVYQLPETDADAIKAALGEGFTMIDEQSPLEQASNMPRGNRMKYQGG